jgi:hypothetical protein
METKVKGRTTLRIAAVCFLASALFEILDVSAPVPPTFAGAGPTSTNPINKSLEPSGIL